MTFVSYSFGNRVETRGWEGARGVELAHGIGLGRSNRFESVFPRVVEHSH